MGWTGPDVAGWFPLHTGSFPLPSTEYCGAQAEAGEWLCLTDLSHPEAVLCPPETAFTQGLGAGRACLHREAQDTGSHSCGKKRRKRRRLTEVHFSSSGAFSVPLHE